jgi:hypothetical protein
MSRSNPWKEIAIPVSSSLNARIVDPSHPLEFYWARDRFGRYLFVLHAQENLVLKKNIPEPAGIRVELGYLDSEKKDQMRLILTDEENYDIFYSLCRDLLEATRNVHNEKTAVEVIITRLRRWQKFMKSAYRKIDEKLIRGIFGEVWFLREIIIPLFGADKSLNFWTGPLGENHDFGIGKTNIEIKTRPATGKPKVSISSAEQLYCKDCSLFLGVLTLAKAKGNEKDALSLRRLVQSVRQKMSGIPDIEEKFGFILV